MPNGGADLTLQLCKQITKVWAITNLCRPAAALTRNKFNAKGLNFANADVKKLLVDGAHAH
jgi:hypothetical protein